MTAAAGGGLACDSNVMFRFRGLRAYVYSADGGIIANRADIQRLSPKLYNLTRSGCRSVVHIIIPILIVAITSLLLLLLLLWVYLVCPRHLSTCGFKVQDDLDIPPTHTRSVSRFAVCKTTQGTRSCRSLRTAIDADFQRVPYDGQRPEAA